MNARQGTAYVYSGTNYATERKLVASDGATYDLFGSSVAISGDGAKVIVGAPSKNSARGTTYVYSGVSFAVEQRLTASDGAANDNFGSSVATSGDGAKVIVGATGKNGYRGGAYAYDGANFATEQTIDGASGDLFGNSVAMSGDGTRAIAGAPGTYDFSVGYPRGKAYLFVFVAPTASLTQIALTVAPGGALKVGETAQVTATGTYADGNTRDITNEVTWISDKPDVANLGNSPGDHGKVMAKAGGAATITATLDGIMKQITVTVSAPILTGVQPAPVPAGRPPGASAPLSPLTAPSPTPNPLPVGR